MKIDTIAKAVIGQFRFELFDFRGRGFPLGTHARNGGRERGPATVYNILKLAAITGLCG